MTRTLLCGCRTCGCACAEHSPNRLEWACETHEKPYEIGPLLPVDFPAGMSYISVTAWRSGRAKLAKEATNDDQDYPGHRDLQHSVA